MFKNIKYCIFLKKILELIFKLTAKCFDKSFWKISSNRAFKNLQESQMFDLFYLTVLNCLFFVFQLYLWPFGYKLSDYLSRCNIFWEIFYEVWF